MAVHETPMQAVKRLYGSKEKLIDSLTKTLRDAEEEAGELKQRLLKISNAKLLRLAEVSKTVSEKYGDKDKLVAAVAEAYGKAKDSDFVTRIGAYSPARLLDMVSAADKRQRK